MKSVKKSMRSMKAILPVDVSMVRKNKNVVMCALVIMILLAKRLRPLVSNMVGKLAVIVLVCYLAMADLSLGLLGVLFFAAVNNSFIEGFKEGTGGAAAGEGGEADDEAKAADAGQSGFTGREGEGHEEEGDDEGDDEVPPPEESQ
tara:strand:+ start:930 stop:1367 length:438 start_codon:yes stop_codon:yes gene_type:complete